MLASDRNPVPRPVRCAVYARKSTLEGLEQSFNSLDAQREACLGYIGAQQAEGWQVLPHIYSDGGSSGANLDRPEMRKLMTDIEAGRVDCVVIHRIDRLSRSLIDFARLMQLFERHQVRLVAVTQQLDTRSPVGRLTLHILLSFAEFEREIIRERTRDKKAASRQKGKWIGGYLPLGFDLDSKAGRLVVHEQEAQQVREIFSLFEETQTVEATLEEMNRRGIERKSWITTKGARWGGGPFTESVLVRLLRSEVYIGFVEYKGNRYRGEQVAIISGPQWRNVQRLLGRRTPRSRGQNHQLRALLQGVVYCADCNRPMRHSFTNRNGKRYRYYICGDREHSGRNRVPAVRLEESFLAHLVAATESGSALGKLVRTCAGQDVVGLEHIARLHRWIERVMYTSTTGEVAIHLRRKGAKRDGPE
jgi:site-specific DNA recombinase